jgi:hypothetical protein
MTVQQNVAVLLALFLLCPGPLAPVTAQQTKPSPEQAIKAKLLEIPTGSTIEVKLRGKPTVRGKLGAVQDNGFELQSLRDGKVVTDSFTLGDVKAVSPKQGHTTRKVVVGVLIGIGVLVAIGVIVAVASGKGLSSAYSAK